MGLFTFIVCFLILLLVIIIVGSIQQFALWIVTRKYTEFVVMIIPSLITLICFGFTISITYLVLNKFFGINSLNILFSIFMKFEYSFNDYIAMLLGYIICAIVFIILQALCLKLVNINYYKIHDYIKYKILKKEEIKTLAASENEQEGKASIDLTHNTLPVLKAKVPFFHYIATSLFTFAISFFSLFGLIYLGIILGQKYIG